MEQISECRPIMCKTDWVTYISTCFHFLSHRQNRKPGPIFYGPIRGYSQIKVAVQSLKTQNQHLEPNKTFEKPKHFIGVKIHTWVGKGRSWWWHGHCGSGLAFRGPWAASQGTGAGKPQKRGRAVQKIKDTYTSPKSPEPGFAWEGGGIRTGIYRAPGGTGVAVGGLSEAAPRSPVTLSSDMALLVARWRRRRCWRLEGCVGLWRGPGAFTSGGGPRHSHLRRPSWGTHSLRTRTHWLAGREAAARRVFAPSLSLTAAPRADVSLRATEPPPLAPRTPQHPNAQKRSAPGLPRESFDYDVT